MSIHVWKILLHIPFLNICRANDVGVWGLFVIVSGHLGSCSEWALRLQTDDDLCSLWSCWRNSGSLCSHMVDRQRKITQSLCVCLLLVKLETLVTVFSWVRYRICCASGVEGCSWEHPRNVLMCCRQQLWLWTSKQEIRLGVSQVHLSWTTVKGSACDSYFLLPEMRQDYTSHLNCLCTILIGYFSAKIKKCIKKRMSNIWVAPSPFSFLSSDRSDSTGRPAFVLCWLHLLFIFTSVCILIWIMEEVSEKEEARERGVPRSMCPWLFSARALLVGGGGVRLGVWLRRFRHSSLLSPLHLLTCLPDWLSCRI